MFRQLIIVGFVALLGLLAGTWWLDRALNEPLAVPVEGYQFIAGKGDGVYRIAYKLQEAGVVRHAFALRLYAKITDRDQVRAGEYALVQGDTIKTLLEKLQKGQTVQYKVTIPEGLTLAQWLGILQEQPNIDRRLSLNFRDELAAILGLSADKLEGWFAPDTYMYSSGDSDIEILQRAYQRMTTIMAEQWEQRAKELPYQSPEEALVMASIIEKETGIAEERDEIAGVFVRRLRKGMRLQTDPTVIYGLGDAYRGNLTRAHLQMPTPYNTYLIDGLPPTAIANPGEAAIHAALHPRPGNSLFFVAKGDGSHHFSATLGEHNEAVRRYQLRRKSDYRSSPR